MVLKVPRRFGRTARQSSGLFLDSYYYSLLFVKVNNKMMIYLYNTLKA